MPNALIIDLCRVMKGLDERIYEGILQLFDHIERMGKDRIIKRTYVVYGSLLRGGLIQ